MGRSKSSLAVKRTLCIFSDQKLSIEQGQSRFPDFLALSDLRQDTLLTMQPGFGYSLAVQMMRDNAVAHHEFPENKLCDMLVQMMYNRCLDDTPWTQHVPDLYFKTAEVTLLAGVYPPEWPEIRDVRDDARTAHHGIEIADSEEEDDPKDEDYNAQEDEAEASEDDVIFCRRDSKKAKYPDLFSSSDESSRDEKNKQSSPSKPGSLSPISSSGGGNNGKKPKRKVSGKRKRHASGGSSDSERASGTYTPSPRRPRPRGSNVRTKSRLAMLRYEDVTDADKAEFEVADRDIVSWRRRGILIRFSPKKDGSERQTPGFPDYAPQMNEVVFLKRRWTPQYRQYLDLLAKNSGR
ncbi:hypothetical protein PHMEG_00028164 [Phytophthora megakarya]|uniref:Uncharacterized protein n=1 Tax=Phytophthora megakarya TaxID=4795 RepID=A0A225V3V1_9STRA|nr:hypothetical protein PHMEG_00028164 [Phytophthora megakarya]